MNPLVSDPVTQLSVHLIQALVRQDTARWKKFKDVSNEQSCIYRDFPVVWLYFHGDICDLWCWNIALEHDSHVPKWQSIGNFGGLMLGLSMDPIKSEINNIYMDNYIHEKPINLKCSCAPTTKFAKIPSFIAVLGFHIGAPHIQLIRIQDPL